MTDEGTRAAQEHLPEREPVSVPHRRWLLFVLGVLGAFGPLSLDAYLPALPRVAAAVHASSSLTQGSITASLAGLAIGQLLVGPASDRRGRRILVLAGPAGFLVFSVLCAVAPSIELLIGFRFLQGLCGAAGIVVSRAIVRDLYSGDELSRIFSRLILVTGTAPVLAPILGAQLLHFTSWRGIFWALAGVGALLLVATAAFVPETLPPERRTSHTVRQDLALYRRILVNRGFLPYLLVTGTFSGVLFAFISGSPFVVEKIFRDSPTVFSLVFAGVSLIMIVLGQLNARFVPRLSAGRLLRGAVAMSAGGSILLLLTTTVAMSAGLWLFVVCLVLTVSPIGGIIFPNANGLALQQYGGNAGAASALMGVATFLIGGVVSPLVGVAGNHTAVPMGILMALGSISGLIVLIMLGPVPASVGRGDPFESRASATGQPGPNHSHDVLSHT